MFLTWLMVFLGISGLAATCFYGVKALKSRRRTQLAFYEEDCISLFESIVQSIEGIEINYEKKPISQNLVLLKGCVANTGGIDIDRVAIHKPLTFSLPQAFKWLKARIVSSSPEVNARYELPNPNELLFIWDLLKPNEYFRFDALAETPPKKENEKERTTPKQALRNSLNFSHRITNLSSLEIGRLRSFRPDRLKIIQIMSLLVAGLFMIGSSFIGWFSTKVVNYQLELDSGQRIVVSAEGKNHNRLLLKEVDGAFKEEINASDLFRKYRATPVVMAKKEAMAQLAVGGFWSIAAGCVLFWYLSSIRRERKRLRMVELLK